MKALWDIPEPTPINDVAEYEGFTLADVVLLSRNAKKSMPLWEAMQRAFEGTSVNIGITEDRTLEDDAIRIRVGPRL